MFRGRRLVELIVAGALSAVLVGCAGDMASSTGPSMARATATGMSSLAASEEIGDYRIANQDALQVTVFQVPDLSRTVQVNGAGFITLPLIGNVPVKGKTLVQAQEDIAARYGKSYLRSPQVTVSLLKSGQRVTVNGAVRGPAVLTVDGRLTLAQAVAQAGGINDLGNSDRVHVARTDGTHVQDVVYNLNEIQAAKVPDPVLRGGDIVVVEESGYKLALKNVKDIMPFAALAAFASDVRLKWDIVPIDARSNGLQLYRYRYVGSNSLYVGVMAQDVLAVAPGAVLKDADGYFRVDYARLGLRLQSWDEWVARHPDAGSVQNYQ